jgi:hypothetical protein
MSVHDWTRVEAGIFHDFHHLWIAELQNTLDGGLLPPNDYALAEEHAGLRVADVLRLHPSPSDGGPPSPSAEREGGLALAESPPKVRRQLTAIETYRQPRRSLATRHVSGHRLMALLEIASPANKDRPESVSTFVAKAAEALELGVHLLVIDVLPPRRHDPRGFHGAIWDEFDETPYDLPATEALTLATYNAGPPVRAYVEHTPVGGTLPETPLFLHPERYLLAPLDAT